MVWSADLPEGNEARKIRYDIVPYTRGRGLDLGCHMWKVYPHFIGIDNIDFKDPSLQPHDLYGYRLSQDIKADATDLSVFASKSMDFVFSSHLLEHIENTGKTLKEWWRVIKPGGHLVLYLPHADYYPNMGEPGSNPEHVHDFRPEDIISVMQRVGSWDLVVNETRTEDDEYSFYQVYEKTAEKCHKYSWTNDRPRKKICIVRFGGFGDMIMTSNVLPGLKAAGWHITVMTTPRGKSVVEHDPHIDDFILCDTNQVPNEELSAFWNVWMKKFDRWLNLSESVEGTFLAMPGRPLSFWPTSLRDDYLRWDYLEFLHRLSNVSFEQAGKFYPSHKETAKAEKRRRKLGGKVLMWCVDGSSVQKMWPYMDNAFARILSYYPDYKIVTVGNKLSSMLEAGWENEPRVIKKCGKWGIRETLAFAQLCDVVIGPETGIMNSVAFLDMPKMMFLSHSSPSNIGLNWKNTFLLTPEGTPCWPCHKMIYEWKQCNRDAVEVIVGDKVLIADGAHCQTHITIDKFWNLFENIA